MRVVLMILGLLLAAVATAQADDVPRVLYPGSRCEVIDVDAAVSAPLEVEKPSLVIPVDESAVDHADHDLFKRCKNQLTDCRADKKPGSKWLVASKWAAIGAALAASFALGMRVAK